MSHSYSATGPLEIGRHAPDFTLQSTPGQKVSLESFRGRPVVLIFYPADFSPVCGDQLTVYNEIIHEFERHNAVLIGISVDGPWCHQAFSSHRHITFPLLADHHPKGAVASLYGVYRAAEGISERALFVIDEQGNLSWQYISPMGENPGAEGILSALESLPGHKRK